ncbi:uncharacterized protein LOC144617800 [Crassostrea virginica]
MYVYRPPHSRTRTWTAVGHPSEHRSMRVGRLFSCTSWNSLPHKKTGVGWGTDVPGSVVPGATHLWSPVTSHGGGCRPRRIFPKNTETRLTEVTTESYGNLRDMKLVELFSFNAQPPHLGGLRTYLMLAT